VALHWLYCCLYCSRSLPGDADFRSFCFFYSPQAPVRAVAGLLLRLMLLPMRPWMGAVMWP